MKKDNSSHYAFTVYSSAYTDLYNSLLHLMDSSKPFMVRGDIWVFKKMKV